MKYIIYNTICIIESKITKTSSFSQLLTSLFLTIFNIYLRYITSKTEVNITSQNEKKEAHPEEPVHIFIYRNLIIFNNNKYYKNDSKNNDIKYQSIVIQNNKYYKYIYTYFQFIYCQGVCL